MPDLTWDIKDADFAPTQAAITDIGAKWVRLEFRWYEGEPRKGSYDAKTLSKWDKAVETSLAAGAQVVAMVHRSPGWASGSSSTYMPPQDPADYANFMRFVVERYKGKVAAWEIWNEQNGSRFWPSGPDPAEYVPLLKAAHGAVKATDPTALVIFGGLVENDYQYVRGAYAAGARGYFDAMNVHPYTRYAPEHYWVSPDGYIARSTFPGYRSVRRVMLEHDDDKPLWFTEFGWSTCTTTAACVTPEVQADYIKRAYCVLDQDPYVHVAIAYNLRNNHWDKDADSWDTQLGLMKTTFEKKPAYHAFKGYSSSSCPSSSKSSVTTSTSAESDDASTTSDVDTATATTGGDPSLAISSNRWPALLMVPTTKIRRGRLVVKGHHALGATGWVSGVARYRGREHRFTTQINWQGRIRIRERLPGGRGVSTARVTLTYFGDARFRKQRLTLNAGSRKAGLQVRQQATAQTSGSGYHATSVYGTAGRRANGSLVLTLFYRADDGSIRSARRKTALRDGEFRQPLKLPIGARFLFVRTVFAGERGRGIGGASTATGLR